MNLEKMLERHDENIYLIHHWTGFVKPSITAKQAARKIKLQMEEVIQVAVDDGRPVDGLLNMSAMANLFIADLWKLSPWEFEKLKKLNDEELMNRVPYTPGLMAPWLAREGRNLRFEE